MAIAQILNYYPKYEYLDSIITTSGKKKLVIYVDLKGCMQSLFQEWAVKLIIEQTRGSKRADPTVFISILEFISFHKVYARKREIEIDLIFFFESGKSEYHTKIHPKYKEKRQKDFFGLDAESQELFFKVLDKNYDIVENVCNKIPGVSVIRLRYMEADFIPFYIQKRVLKEDPNRADVIYSIDKDMLQCLSSDSYIFYKHYKRHKLMNGDVVFKHYLKADVDWDLDPELMFLMLAIDGDTADGFNGVPGIGGVTLSKIFPDICKICGSVQEICKNVYEKKTIFQNQNGTNIKSIQKIIDNEDIVVRNIKLASYRMLSDYIDSDFPLVNVKRKQQIIDSVYNDTKIRNGTVLFEALEKIGVSSDMSEASIFNLFR